jgi:hypothetical protein
MPSVTLQGLTGLYGSGQENTDPSQYMDEGVLEARAAPGTATSHGEYGSQTFGYGGTVPTDPQTDPQQTVYDGAADGDSYWGYDFSEGGEALDRTPTTHDVPWPRGIPQEGFASLSTPGGLEIAGAQMQTLHGTNLGGVNKNVLVAPAGHEEITHYTTDDYIAPNENILGQNIGQLRGANGSSSGLLGGGGSGHGNAGGSAADPDQGYGVVNTLPEFNAGHSIRRVQHDRMPWDFTATHGEKEVPFLGRHDLVGQMDFDGPDSPYFAQGSLGGPGLGVAAPMIYGDPTEYVQPPEPVILPAPSGNTDDIYAWG